MRLPPETIKAFFLLGKVYISFYNHSVLKLLILTLNNYISVYKDIFQ